MTAPVHHRRFACGYRACELDGPPTPTEHDDTQDVTLVTCPECLSALEARRLLYQGRP